MNSKIKSSMKKTILTLMTICFIGSSGPANAVTVGEDAPDFKTNDVNGAEFSLSAQKGKIVVLEWTNPQCPFVKKQYDSNSMQALQKKYTEAGVVWVSVNSSAEGREGYLASDSEAKKLITDKQASSSFYIRDSIGDIGKSFRATTTPHMFIIDKSGKVVYAGAIDSIPSANKDDVAKAENYVAVALDELLAGKEVTKQNTTAYGCSVKY